MMKTSVAVMMTAMTMAMMKLQIALSSFARSPLRLVPVLRLLVVGRKGDKRMRIEYHSNGARA